MIMPVGAWADLNQFLSHMRASGLASGTINLRMTYLLRLAAWADDRSPWSLTTDELTTFLAQNDWKPETRKSARSSVRAFYKWAADTDRVSRNPALRLPAVKVPSGAPKPAPLAVMMAALSAANPRTRLMILLAAHAGLRRNEIATLHTDDVEPGFLRITGKGSKVRRVPMHPDLTETLAAMPCGYVFPGRVDGHISANRVGELITEALGGRYTAHTLRHRFASSAYSDTRDIAVVQRLLGHSRPETTMRYTEVPDELLVEAVLAMPSLTAALTA